MTEHDIQNAVRLKLSEYGYYTERINVGAGYLIPNRLMDKLKRSAPPELRIQLNKIPYFTTGAVKGRSDLSAIKEGRITFIEVKTDLGAASDEQLSFIAVMRDRYGCTAGIVRSVDDAVKLVEGDKNDT